MAAQNETPGPAPAIFGDQNPKPKVVQKVVSSEEVAPAAPPPVQAVLPQAPQVMEPIRPKKPSVLKPFFILIILLAVLGGAVYAGFMLFDRYKGALPKHQGQEQETSEHTVETFPEFPAIPIAENTVAFTKVDNKFCLRYKGKIYLEQESGSYDPRLVPSDTPAGDYPWYGLVDIPEESEVFSFKATPSNKSFIFTIIYKNLFI